MQTPEGLSTNSCKQVTVRTEEGRQGLGGPTILIQDVYKSPGFLISLLIFESNNPQRNLYSLLVITTCTVKVGQVSKVLT